MVDAADPICSGGTVRQGHRPFRPPLVDRRAPRGPHPRADDGADGRLHRRARPSRTSRRFGVGTVGEDVGVSAKFSTPGLTRRLRPSLGHGDRHSQGGRFLLDQHPHPPAGRGDGVLLPRSWAGPTTRCLGIRTRDAGRRPRTSAACSTSTSPECPPGRALAGHRRGGEGRGCRGQTAVKVRSSLAASAEAGLMDIGGPGAAGRSAMTPNGGANSTSGNRRPMPGMEAEGYAPRGAELVRVPDDRSWRRRPPSFHQACSAGRRKVQSDAGGRVHDSSRTAVPDIAGMMTLSAGMPDLGPPHWTTYFTVDDADEAAKTAEGLGATLCVPPMIFRGSGVSAASSHRRGSGSTRSSIFRDRLRRLIISKRSLHLGHVSRIDCENGGGRTRRRRKAGGFLMQPSECVESGSDRTGGSTPRLSATSPGPSKTCRRLSTARRDHGGGKTGHALGRRSSVALGAPRSWSTWAGCSLTRSRSPVAASGSRRSRRPGRC